MNCSLYAITDDRNKINKSLGSATEKTIIFLDSEDILHPKIRLSAFPASLNYCYIQELNRYYFIDSVEIMRNGLFYVKLSCDVLYTYKTEIANSVMDITQSSNVINENKTDYESENIENVLEYNLTSPFTNSSDIMVTVQGVI